MFCFDSVRQTVDALIVVAIQAYYELNRSTEILPFVTMTYNGLEDCPIIIAQLW